MLAIIKKFRTLIAYCFLTLFSLTCIILSGTNFTMSLKNIYMVGIFPIQKAALSLSRAIERIYNNINDMNNLVDELSASRKRLAEVEGAMTSIEDLKRDNERLRKLLNERLEMEYSVEYARVVSKDPQNYYTTIVIDKGTANGIEIGMPVIGYNKGTKGIVGKIIEVKRNYSKVLPLIDRNSQIGVMLDVSRNVGILQGQSLQTVLCHLQFIDKSVEVEEGEFVITSGMGGVFPKGYIIGTVFKVEKKNYGLFHDIYVKPVIEFASLEDVYVIKKITDNDLTDLIEEGL